MYNNTTHTLDIRKHSIGLYLKDEIGMLPQQKKTLFRRTVWCTLDSFYFYIFLFIAAFI